MDVGEKDREAQGQSDYRLYTCLLFFGGGVCVCVAGGGGVEAGRQIGRDIQMEAD